MSTQPSQKTGRIIFVGVHNKPGLKPLDSKSVSGKRVDLIIERMNADCVKTNLFDCDYLPRTSEERQEMIYQWLDRINPDANDVIVLLGAIVHKEFPKIDFCRIVKIAHPSLQFSKYSPKEYVDGAIAKLNSK